MNHFEERPLTLEIQQMLGPEVIRIWKLKRDNGIRLVQTVDGKIYIMGDSHIVTTFTDEEWLEAIQLRVTNET